MLLINYKYIASSIQEGIEELEKIKALAERKTLTEGEFKVRLYAALLDLFRGYNLKDADLKTADFYKSTRLPKEIVELFKK